MSGWATRLKAVFGTPLDEIAEEYLQRLVDEAVHEYSDLDFKQETYGNGEEDRRELAADIAAFANDRGGVIVIGVREENDAATELTPIALDNDEIGRMRSIAAAKLAPYAWFEPRKIPSVKHTGRGYYLLVVPPSPDRPHAVRKHNDLRYPRRNGAQKRWLSESEVADAYRDRFARVTDDLGRIEQVLGEGRRVLTLNSELAYLVIGIVPSQPGAFQIDAAAVERVETWAREQSDLWSSGDPFSAPFDGGGGPIAGVGVRRIRLGSAGSQGLNSSYGYIELHTDGAVFIMRQLSLRVAGNIERLPSDQPGPDEKILPINNLTLGMAGCLRAAARLSTEIAGAFGDCITVADLYGVGLRLIEHRGSTPPAMIGQEPIEVVPVRSRHTLTLDSLVEMSPNLLLATRLVCADLVQAFGAAELSTITADGHLSLRAFPPNSHTELTKWSEHTEISLAP